MSRSFVSISHQPDNSTGVTVSLCYNQNKNKLCGPHPQLSPRCYVLPRELRLDWREVLTSSCNWLSPDSLHRDLSPWAPCIPSPLMIYKVMAAMGQIGALIKAADVSVELLWPGLLAEALVSINQIGGLICNWGRGQELQPRLQAVLRRRECKSPNESDDDVGFGSSD